MIIITGASQGIGKYLFDYYASLGKLVYGTYHSTVNEDLISSPQFYKLDISNYFDVKLWIEEIKSNLNNIILINCAGINYNSYAHKADITKWANVINVNLIGTFNVINCLLPSMREQSFGRIINFGSVVANLPSPGVSAYAASKSALIGMTKSIAVENALKGITINTVNLGYSELGMINEVPKEFLSSILNKIPSNKLCKASDIYNTVEYLINTEYITGSEINISGGLI
jgi:NAD(P)-dependent dehydrogenase (short-subunit alcohol dehydrogenase family)